MKANVLKLFSTTLGVAVLAGGLSLHNGQIAKDEKVYQALENKITGAIREYGWPNIDPHDREPRFVACQGPDVCVLASTINTRHRKGSPLKVATFVRGGKELVDVPAVLLD